MDLRLSHLNCALSVSAYKMEIGLRESELIQGLHRELLSAGYPEDAIKFEYAAPFGNDKYQYIDLAIIDPENGDVLAIYEVKVKASQDSVKKAGRRLAELASLFPNNPQCFTYIAKHDTAKLSVVNTHSSTSVSLTKIPSFESVKNTNTVKELLEYKNKSKVAMDSFKVTSYLLATIMLVVLVLDVFSIYTFTTQQLSLLFIAGGLFIIPHAAKVKVAGLEFERHQSSNEKNT